MKKIGKLVIGFAIVGMICGCSTAPYRQVTELPSDIVYYPKDKQYNLKPDWYWRLRPETISLVTPGSVIDFKFLNDKVGDATVVGEITKNGERFFVAMWVNNGYFFIREKDYQFSLKNVKYLVPLNYGDKELYANLFLSAVLSNPIQMLSDQSADNQNSNYLIHTLINLKKYFESKNLFVISVLGIYQTGMIMREEFSKDVIRQIIVNESYSNEFLIIPFSKPLYESLLTKNEINPRLIEFPSQLTGNQMYTNKFGAVMNGNVYTAQYIVARWGSVFYAFPCGE